VAKLVNAASGPGFVAAGRGGVIENSYRLRFGDGSNVTISHPPADCNPVFLTSDSGCLPLYHVADLSTAKRGQSWVLRSSRLVNIPESQTE